MTNQPEATGKFLRAAPRGAVRFGQFIADDDDVNSPDPADARRLIDGSRYHVRD